MASSYTKPAQHVQAWSTAAIPPATRSVLVVPRSHSRPSSGAANSLALRYSHPSPSATAGCRCLGLPGLTPGPQVRATSAEQGAPPPPPPAQGQARRIPLGRSSLLVPPLGIGTLQWGDPGQGFGRDYEEETLQAVYQRLLGAGLDFFDTAEVYGYESIKAGASAEQLLGKFEGEAHRQGLPGPAVIGTKFFTIPWTNLLVGGGFRLGRKSLLEALRASLGRLGRKKVDLYQIHFPFPTFSNAALMDALAQAQEEGLCAAVGVSNYSPAEMAEAHDLLSKRGIPLASNQVRYSVLYRRPETNGLLQMAKELGVSLIAYSPLASGIISEKQLLNPTSGEGKKALPVLRLLLEVGQQHGATISQVALAYLISKGALPIPACKTISQAESHIATLNISLTDDEVCKIEEGLLASGY